MNNPTFFGLLAEFGAAEIPLEAVALKYFGLTPAEAKTRANLQQLPIHDVAALAFHLPFFQRHLVELAAG